MAVIFFSLSCLGKYNAVFYGLGILLFVIVEQEAETYILPLHLCMAFFIFLILSATNNCMEYK